MKKPITIGVIAVIAAILVTSAVDYSAIGEKPQPEVQKTPPTIELTPAASDDGFLFPTSVANLYFGDTLCKVAAASGKTFYFEFATPTLVKHNDVACPEINQSALILLSGSQDVQFQIGDILVLHRDCQSCTVPYDEVHREQTP